MTWLWLALALTAAVVSFGAGFYFGARETAAEIEDWLMFGGDES